MATKASIAIHKSASIDRITGALNRMREDEGFDPVDLPRLSRFPELLHNQQLEAIASALEVLSPAPEPEPEAMTLPEDEMPDVHLRVFDDDPEDDEPEVTEFDVNAEGVIVAETEDGETIVSDGQEEPEPRKGKGRR